MQNVNFRNLNITISDLPDSEDLKWQALSPRYVPLNLGLNLLTTAVLALIYVVMQYQPFWALSPQQQAWADYLGLGLITLSFLYSIYSIFVDRRAAYALRAHDLSFRSGLLFRQTVTQPLTRIQHIELKRGPLERSMGLATLQVFSAGGSAHTFQIPGLAVERARELRQFVLQHQDLQHDG